jgi:hypothetical protein
MTFIYGLKLQLASLQQNTPTYLQLKNFPELRLCPGESRVLEIVHMTSSTTDMVGP